MKRLNSFDSDSSLKKQKIESEVNKLPDVNDNNELVKGLPFICHKNYSNKPPIPNYGNGVFDIREYWKSLKKYPFEITNEIINETYGENCSFDDECGMKALFFLVSNKIINNFNVTFTKIEKSVINNLVVLDNANAFFNIKIYGATYAKLLVKESQIPMDYNEQENYFTFNDITLDNPLFNSFSGDVIKIFTDGETYTTNVIFMDFESIKYITKLGNHHVVSWFPLKNIVLFLGHMWANSYIYNINDVVKIEQV